MLVDNAEFDVRSGAIAAAQTPQTIAAVLAPGVDFSPTDTMCADAESAGDGRTGDSVLRIAHRRSAYSATAGIVAETAIRRLSLNF